MKCHITSQNHQNVSRSIFDSNFIYQLNHVIYLLSCNSFIVTLILNTQKIIIWMLSLAYYNRSVKSHLYFSAVSSQKEKIVCSSFSTVISLLLSSLYNKNNAPFHVCLRARAVGTSKSNTPSPAVLWWAPHPAGWAYYIKGDYDK